MSSNGKRKASRTKSPAQRGAAPAEAAPEAGAGALALAGDESTGSGARGSSAFVDRSAEARSAGLSDVDLPLLEAARDAAASAGVEIAAVRDDAGRMHTAAPITLTSLRTSAVRAAALSAVLSGSTRIRAAVIVSDAVAPAEGDLAALLELGGPGLPIVLVGAGGNVRTRLPV